MEEWKKSELEFLRIQAKQNFDKVRASFIECGKWALPHKIKWMTNEEDGSRNNPHIVDSTHIIALRSYVAGFLEGNTSASRPWYRLSSRDPEANEAPDSKEWNDTFTRRTLHYLGSSNFYHAAGEYYYDYGTFNTGALWIDELRTGLHFHNLVPGSYFPINDSFGVAATLVREFSLNVNALVKRYGKKVDGDWDWSNFSSRVKKLYEDSNYSQKINCVSIATENKNFDPNKKNSGKNRRWVAITYELGGENGQYYADGMDLGNATVPRQDDDTVFLNKAFSKRKPFIVGKSNSNNNFEYGEKGPTLDALGLIKSLNKKAIGKDQALEQMLRPAMQGPANLRKSYITTAPNAYIPLDPSSLSQKGLQKVFDVNPAVGAIAADVIDLRDQVEKLYYADYLLYLTRNPKTRTATETNAVVQEQQLIIGPNLQSLNWTFNIPVVEYVMDYVIDTDPYLPPAPESLGGTFMQAEFISVFAQAQKAADLPNINQFLSMVANLSPEFPDIKYKINIDKIVDVFDDRLYLPAKMVNSTDKANGMREQALQEAKRQQTLHETLPALAGAAKDAGLQMNQPGAGQPPQR